MASIAGACSSGSILKCKESRTNGGAPSLFQYSGLKAMDLGSKKQKGFGSKPGLKCRGIKAMASSAPKRETDPKKRVVITGMGLVSVFGNDIDTFYNRLLQGESGISLVDRFDASTFSVRFAGQIRGFSSAGYIDGKNDHRLDDCWRYCLVAGRRALDDADLGLELLDKRRRSQPQCRRPQTQLCNSKNSSKPQPQRRQPQTPATSTSTSTN